MTTIRCFLLEPVDQAQESLRRYCLREDAPCLLPHGYHDASMVIGTVPLALDAHGTGADDRDHADLRWPVACKCGYVFEPGDQWQHNVERLYRRGDTGALATLPDAPVGAMWFAPWYEDTYRGPDGRCLVVKTPGGEWSPDQPSSSGTPWQRTGEAPLVTASPSIGMRNRDGSWRYHAWLRNGELVDA